MATTADKLDELIASAERAKAAARADRLYASWTGFALFSAMEELCAGMAPGSIADDIRHELCGDQPDERDQRRTITVDYSEHRLGEAA